MWHNLHLFFPLRLWHICYMRNFAEIIRKELKSRNLSPITAALTAGLRRDAIRSVLRGRTPSIDRAAEICEALELDYRLGPPCEESDFSPVERLEVTLREAAKLLDELRREAALAPTDTEAAVKMCHVEVVELDAAAGDGADVELEAVRGSLAFRADWLKRHRLDPEQCRVIGVRGESMEPLLPEGCSILIDCGQRRRRQGRIYVLRGEDGLFVKRATRDGNTWILESEHPAWKPIPWPRGAEVLGEVVWMARTLIRGS